MKRLQVKIDGKWEYVFCYDQWKQIVTTKNRLKALGAKRDLEYFQAHYMSKEFRSEE